MSRISLIKNRNFVALWFANLASLIGDKCTQIALPLFIIEKFDSPSALAMVSGAGACASFGLIFVGVIADRFSRKYLLMLSDIIRFVLYCGLVFVLPLEKNILLPLVMGFAFLNGICNLLFSTTFNIVIPDVVDTKELSSANSLLHLGKEVTRVAGPPLAAMLIAWFAFQGAILFDAVTFLVSFVCVASISRLALANKSGSGEPAKSTKEGVSSKISYFLGGYRFVIDQPRYLALVFVRAISSLIIVPTLIIGLPLVVTQHFGGIPNAMAMLLATQAIGGIPMALFLSGKVKGFSAFSASIPSLLLISLGLFLIGSGIDFWVAIIGTCIVGSAMVLFNISFTSSLQATAPRQALGRIFAAFSAIDIISAPLGYLVVGFLFSAFSIEKSYLISTVFIACSSGIVFFIKFAFRKQFSKQEET